MFPERGGKIGGGSEGDKKRQGSRDGRVGKKTGGILAVGCVVLGLGGGGGMGYGGGGGGEKGEGKKWGGGGKREKEKAVCYARKLERTTT